MALEPTKLEHDLQAQSKAEQKASWHLCVCKPGGLALEDLGAMDHKAALRLLSHDDIQPPQIAQVFHKL